MALRRRRRSRPAHRAADRRRPAPPRARPPTAPSIRADDTDLAYVAITVEDDAGNVACHRDRPVSVDVGGAGVLSGLGSARPWTEEPFGGSQCTTFDGRALAIVRPTGPGDIEIRVGAEGCETVTVAVRAAS